MARAVFTGLVQTQGQLLGRSARANGLRLVIGHDFGTLQLGESIAVNGACLTVASFSDGRFEADCSGETHARTTLGTTAIGVRMHLERALRVGDRLGGHYVTGHIDAKVPLIQRSSAADSLELEFELPASLRAFVAVKGSITLDGVSLTVNRSEARSFSVTIIPHSQSETHLGSLRRGDEVNVEVDVLSRYVVHLATLGYASRANGAPDMGAGAGASDDDSLRKALAKAGML